MTPTDVHSAYKQVLSYLSNGKLKNAFENTEILNEELQSPAIKENLLNMQTSYKFMLQYFIDGKTDPDRKTIYNKLIAKLFVLVSQLRDELLTRDSNNFEFSQKRYFPYTPQISIGKLTKDLKRLELQSEAKELEPENQEKLEKIELEFENAIRFLFQYFWLKTTYESATFLELYKNLMSDENKDSTIKSILISALTLNLWRTFDENKILMLIEASKSNDVSARQRALVGLCFVLAKYNRFLPFFPSIRNSLIILVDNNSISESLQNIIIQIIATTETEQITKKLQEEIFPELMKLRPMLDRGLSDENLLNTDEWGEINPDWQEMIENSGASDKIQELAEMEMSGADVYMSTFAMLKSFPFFSDFSNWFLPFDTQHSAVHRLFQSDEKSMISAFLNSNAMCNSDRYSFCLSILQMPDMQRNMMKKSFGEAAEQLEEMKKEEALYSPQVQAKADAKHYIQDLFRFFKLNPYRNDFADFFSTSLILHKTYLFDMLSVNDELKFNIAEYYFSKKLYMQALELYNEIVTEESENSAIIYQKIAYSYQQTSQLFNALQAYKKADLIQPDDFWTNRKMALCYMLTGDIENALKTYQHALYIKPENLSIRLQIVNCKMELKKFDEALKNLMEIHSEYPENQRVIRLIIRCSAISKNLQQAKYFAAILLENPDLTAVDYISAANIAWCLDENEEAKEYYNHSLQKLENNWVKFLDLFYQEKELLLINEVNENDLPLILDAIEYNMQKPNILV